MPRVSAQCINYQCGYYIACRDAMHRVSAFRRFATRLYESYRIFETRGIASLQIVSNI